ncbi:MAG: ComEC/Rec2 family competence protein, partial [Bacilli bacterium]|nr:ComEC/Rec2 family competence protein [Bacilli bacterium]
MSSIKSRIESQYDYYHFIVLGLVLLGLAVKFVLVSLLLVLYLVFLFIKKRDTFWFLLIIILIFLAVFSIKEVCYYALPLPSKGVVLEKAQATSTNKYLVQTGLSKVIIYAKEELREGDVISFTGEASTYQIHYSSGFDYQSYLHFQNIRNSIVADSVIKKGHIITPYYLHEAVNRYLENSFQGEARVYLKVFITGTSDELEKEPLNNLGISHLFVISGLHVSLLLGIIKKTAHLLKLSSKTEFIISCLFLGCYLLLTAFLISVIRVVVSFLLKKKMSISGLDLASFNFTSVLLVNPYYLWQTSFILSYAIYLFLSIYESFKITKQPFFNKLINLWVLT